MIQKIKSFLSNKNLSLSLCAVSVLVLIAVLLSVKPLSQNPSYKPAAAVYHGSYKQNLAQLVLDESQGQSSGQSNTSSGSAAIGVAGAGGNSGSVQPAGSAVSSPVYTAPTQPPVMPPSHDIEPDPLYPIDPIPCKSLKPGIRPYCTYCADNWQVTDSCGCGGYQGADIVCLAQ